LMAALTAGDLAGGQKTGRESAALLVKTVDGWPLDIDLRVDHSNDPVRDLQKLLDMQLGRQQVIQAGIIARKGQMEEAKVLLMEAVARGAAWPRVWIRAARVASSIEETTLALQYIEVAFSQNPAWAPAEIGEGNYAELGANASFHRWVSAEQEQSAVAAYEQLLHEKEIKPEERIRICRMLLETGHSKEAILVLEGILQRLDEPVELRLLRSTAYAASGEYGKAIGQCEAALKKEPDETRVRRRMAQLKQQVELQKSGK
jgi:tetratricopeptide (TPR) repeat protein